MDSQSVDSGLHRLHCWAMPHTGFVAGRRRVNSMGLHSQVVQAESLFREWADSSSGERVRSQTTVCTVLVDHNSPDPVVRLSDSLEAALVKTRKPARWANAHLLRVRSARHRKNGVEAGKRKSKLVLCPRSQELIYLKAAFLVHSVGYQADSGQSTLAPSRVHNSTNCRRSRGMFIPRFGHTDATKPTFRRVGPPDRSGASGRSDLISERCRFVIL